MKINKMGDAAKRTRPVSPRTRVSRFAATSAEAKHGVPMSKRILTGSAVALVVLFPGGAAAQKPGADCSALTAQVEALSEQLGHDAAGDQVKLSNALSDQVRYAAAAQRRRVSNAAVDTASSVVGSVVPGADLVGAVIGAAGQGSKSELTAPDHADLAQVATGMIKRAQAASRIGLLLDKLRVASCPGSPRL